MRLTYGHYYKFKGDNNTLVYLGTGDGPSFGWHQFARVGGITGKVWAEVHPNELDLIEEVNINDQN